jgi:CDP-6-deoxy-D-xylo-4-hexulose-3-dehydrase
VAGNLLKQPFLKGHRFSYHKDTYNSDIIHDLGMYIGNSHFIGKNHLNLLSKIMKELSKEYEETL